MFHMFAIDHGSRSFTVWSNRTYLLILSPKFSISLEPSKFPFCCCWYLSGNYQHLYCSRGNSAEFLSITFKLSLLRGMKWWIHKNNITASRWYEFNDKYADTPDELELTNTLKVNSNVFHTFLKTLNIFEIILIFDSHFEESNISILTSKMNVTVQSSWSD